MRRLPRTRPRTAHEMIRCLLSQIASSGASPCFFKWNKSVNPMQCPAIFHILIQIKSFIETVAPFRFQHLKQQTKKISLAHIGTFSPIGGPPSQSLAIIFSAYRNVFTSCLHGLGIFSRVRSYFDLREFRLNEVDLERTIYSKALEFHDDSVGSPSEQFLCPFWLSSSKKGFLYDLRLHNVATKIHSSETATRRLLGLKFAAEIRRYRSKKFLPPSLLLVRVLAVRLRHQNEPMGARRLNHVISNEPMMAFADTAGRSNASRRTDFLQLRPRVDAAWISASRP